ncbi:hypothetical protein Tco_1148823 [Tanacetum coccineum]
MEGRKSLRLMETVDIMDLIPFVRSVLCIIQDHALLGVKIATKLVDQSVQAKAQELGKVTRESGKIIKRISTTATTLTITNSLEDKKLLELIRTPLKEEVMLETYRCELEEVIVRGLGFQSDDLNRNAYELAYYIMS